MIQNQIESNFNIQDPTLQRRQGDAQARAFTGDSVLKRGHECLRAGPVHGVLEVFVGAPADLGSERASPRADLRLARAARGAREAGEVRERLAPTAAHHPDQR